MGVLLLLFILVPAVEVTLLAQIVGHLGALNTLLLVVDFRVQGQSERIEIRASLTPDEDKNT